VFAFSNVFYIREAFNLLSQSQLFIKGIRFEPVTHFGYNGYDADGELAPCVDMLFPPFSRHDSSHW
jgi:hypothetical protein